MTGYKKHSTNAKDLIDDKFGPDITETIQEMADINGNKYNMIVIIAEPRKAQNIAAMLFSAQSCVDPSSGKPMIDDEKFNALSDDEKRAEIDGMLNTMSGFIKTIESLKAGIYEFSNHLLQIDKSLGNKN